MVLRPEDTQRICSFIQKEPRMVQDIAKHIKKTWVTANAYVEKIKAQTGCIKSKVFRDGTRGAIKVVYWNAGESAIADEVRKHLYERIKLGAKKTDIDPLDIFQYVASEKKHAVLERYTNPLKASTQEIGALLQQTKKDLYCFSGNMSWLRMEEHNIPILATIKKLLERGVHIHVLCRVDLASVENINLLSSMSKQYGAQLDVRHAYHPLRGFILDTTQFRLKDEKDKAMYKEGELKGNLRVFYDVYDEEWISWLQQVFWNLYRTAPTMKERMKELDAIF